MRDGSGILAFQFSDKLTWYYIALGIWALGLLVRWWIDRSMTAYALEAIAEDEDAAGAAGVNVTAEKLTDLRGGKGFGRASVEFVLTEKGREYARDAIGRSTYIGLRRCRSSNTTR